MALWGTDATNVAKRT